MNDFRKLAHLREQLGEENFNALIDPEHTGEVKNFCDELLQSIVLPSSLTLSGRTYLIRNFLRPDETKQRITGYEMLARTKGMDRAPDKLDTLYVMERQDQIPMVCRRRMSFVFTGWLHYSAGENKPVSVACMYWHKNRWILDWSVLGEKRYDNIDVVLERQPGDASDDT